MLAGELFVLLGMQTNDAQFRQASLQLAAVVKIAREAVSVVQEVGHALVDMALEAAESATHTLGLAASLGMSTKSIQEWSYVAKQAGSDVNQFTVGISMFERNLREFAEGRGSKRFKDSMHQVGISATEAKAFLHGPDGVNAAIFKVSDAYEKMGNSADRAAINTGLFGARARGMAQDLGKGSAALRQQIEHFHQIGGLVDDEQLNNLKKFNNAVNDLQVAWHAMSMKIVAALGPKFTKMLEEMTDWLEKNRDTIDRVLSAAFGVLAFAINAIFKVIQFVGAVIKGFLDGDVGAVALVSLLAVGFITLAVVMITVLLPAIITIGTALWAAMLPILPIVAAIVLIAALAYLIYKNWGPIKEWFANLWEKISDKAKAFWDSLGDAIVATGRFFENLGRTILKALGDAWDSVVETTKKAMQTLVNDLIWVVNKMIAALNALPGVHIDAIADVNWVKHNSPTAGAGGTSGTTSTGTPNVTMGVPTAQRQSSSLGGGGNNVNVAPTTVNIYGVKDAAEAKQKISEEIDNRHRHAAAALGGEIQ